MDDDVAEELKTTETLVMECLEEDSHARNSDKWLLLRIWQKKQHIKMFIPYDKLPEMISAETITRVRRKIQNTDGKLLPTDPEVLTRRKFKEEEVREYFGENSETHKEFQERLYGIK